MGKRTSQPPEPPAEEPPPHVTDVPYGDYDHELDITPPSKANGKHVPDHLTLTGLNLIRGGKKGDGPPKPLMANVVKLLRAEKQFFDLCHDEFSHRTYRGNTPLVDSDYLEITDWVQNAGIHADVNVVANAVKLIAHECKFHQVKDYLFGLTWDGEPRLDMLLIDHGGAIDTPLTRAMTSKWFISAIARIMEPGCQADSILILEGDQGRKKSNFFFTIAQPWYVGHLSHMGKKDAMEELRNVWIVEFAELDTMRGSAASQIKEFITRRLDNYRASYGRLSEAYPRQCVFGGTINPDASGTYLNDPTGARRYWPVHIPQEIDLDCIRLNRDQYWAEALVRYLEGERWYLDDPGLVLAARAAQEDRYEADVWEDVIGRFLIQRVRATVEDIMRGPLNMGGPENWAMKDQMRVGKVMTRMKWKRKRVSVPATDGGERSLEWAYFAPEDWSAESAREQYGLDLR